MKPEATFKKEIINNISQYYSKFFIHVAPHADVVIGKRGLINEEKTKGIVLVFGNQSYTDFHLEDTFISVQMKFSGKWESVIIPYDSIAALFNDPVGPEFIINFKTSEKIKETKSPEGNSETVNEGKVIRHDFGKKKQETEKQD